MDMGGGKWTVPWISSRARPLGVCRRGGRGFVAVVLVVLEAVGGGWRVIVGIFFLLIRRQSRWVETEVEEFVAEDALGGG